LNDCPTDRQSSQVLIRASLAEVILRPRFGVGADGREVYNSGNSSRNACIEQRLGSTHVDGIESAAAPLAENPDRVDNNVYSVKPRAPDLSGKVASEVDVNIRPKGGRGVRMAARADDGVTCTAEAN